MSQDTRNRQSDRQGNSGHGNSDNNERNSNGGFGGMNYEQIRQPYGRNSGDRDKEESENESENRRNDDL